MNANEGPAHESFIKTPKHLVIAIALGFAVPVGLALLFAKLATSGRTGDKDSPAMSAEAIEKRILPVADADIGKKVYAATCMACHAAGVANAPKFGDKKAWAPHLARGVDELHQSALKGKGTMPPKGGNLTLSEAEVKAAVDYILSAAR